MGVISYDVESVSPLPAALVYQKFILESDTIIPKAVPQFIKGVEILEGDGGAGTIQQITFAAENNVIRTVKHKVEELDKEKLTYSYSIIEGEYITGGGGGGVESISYHMQFVPSDEGGCILKNKTIFTVKDGFTIPEDEVKVAIERSLFGLFKPVEAYVLANP